MGFWENIDGAGSRINVYDQMKKSILPIYIYGAGNLAENILKKLNEYGIKLEGCITDSGEEKFGNYKVYKYDDFINSREENFCNLLIGFASAYERKQILRKERVFNQVFVIANPFDHHVHFDYGFVKDHREQLEEAYDLLADKYSKQCFCAFINARIWENSDYVQKIFWGEIDEFNNDVITTEADEVFLDVGAYNGGSIKRFLKSNNGRYKKIIGIEPEDINFKNLEMFCYKNNICADLYKIGCWNKKDRLFFNGSDDKCCRLDKNGEDCIEVDTIDNIVSADVAVSMFNLGISTAELEILEGAQRTIEKNLPKILVFMGSAKEELYTIPQYVKELNESYQIYLRFIQAMPSRIFMYAVPVLK